MSKKNKQQNPSAGPLIPGMEDKKRERAFQSVFSSGFERPRGTGWGQAGGFLLAGIIGACAALVIVLAVVGGAFRGVPYLDRIDVMSLFSPTTPITIARTERVTVTADERMADVIARFTPSLIGVYAEKDVSQTLAGLIASAGSPRAHAVVLTSDGWLLASGELNEAQAGGLTALTAEGKPYAVTARVQDPATGLWLLKVDASTLVAAALTRDPAALPSGTSAVLMQFRIGAHPLVTAQEMAGTVTLPYRNADRLEARIRLARPVSGFFIGAPVVTMGGEVVGVVSAVDAGGVAYAVPLPQVAAVFDEVFKHRTVTRPRVGIRYVELSQVADLAFPLTRGRRQGALLAKNGTIPAVAPKSNAERAGLKEGDMVMKVERDLVREESDLATLLQSYSAEDTVKLTVVREGEERLIDLALSPPSP